MSKKNSMQKILIQQSLSNRIYYEITSTCNLKCTHCSELLENHEKKEINAKDIISFQKKMSKLGIDNSVVTGGEPSIHNDFYYIIEELAKIGQVLITSNGVLINKEKIARLMKLYPNIRLQLSMDGADKKVFEDIRGKNTFNKLISLIKYLKEKNLQKQIGVSMTIMQKNMHQVIKLIEFADKNEIGSIHFPSLLPIGASKRKWNEIAPDINTQIKIEETLRDIIANDKYNSFISSNRIEQIITKIISQGNCDCLNNMTLKVIPDGSILPCPATSNPDYSIGNISEENITDIIMKRLDGKKNQYVDLINTNLEECKNCKFRGYCNSRFCANCALLVTPEEVYSKYNCQIIRHHLKNALEEIGDNNES